MIQIEVQEIQKNIIIYSDLAKRKKISFQTRLNRGLRFQKSTFLRHMLPMKQGVLYPNFPE